jgi:hypothetical protein
MARIGAHLDNSFYAEEAEDPRISAHLDNSSYVEEKSPQIARINAHLDNPSYAEEEESANSTNRRSS